MRPLALTTRFLRKPMNSPRKKVVCAMSGGVDSYVAAALLLRAGYDVVGVFMRLGSPDGVEARDPSGCGTSDFGELSRAVPLASDSSGKSKQGCFSVLDAADAHRVVGLLGIPLYVLNF